VKAGERLGAYELNAELGRGFSASTWLATRIPAESQDPAAAQAPLTPMEGSDAVILKILDLSETPVWSTVDLFRREAGALEGLSHPGIPRYLDSFEVEEGGRLRLVLAMERIDGENLERLVKSGRRLSETEVESILAGIADILAYLGSIRPPVVHRDVNPRNIVLRPDGRVALVDFSGVQEAVRSALNPGATLVGTAGYTPLEQVAGRASPRSDLYGAAATAVFLLTGRNPAELPSKNLKIDLSGIVDLSPRLASVLGSWLEPDSARRTLGATDAACILRGEKEPQSSGFMTPTRQPLGEEKESGIPATLPSDSRVQILHDAESLHITIPPQRIGGGNGAAPGAIFAASWLGFVGFWTFMALRMRAPIFFPMFSIPFWIVGIFMARTFIGSAFTTTEISLNSEGLLHSAKTFWSDRRQAWTISDLGRVRQEKSPIAVNGQHAKAVVLDAGTQRLRIGSGLSDPELASIEENLRETLRVLKAAPRG
jgi:serine/threonine protein kinase